MKIVLKIGGSVISEKDPARLADFPLSAAEVKKRGEKYMKLDAIARIAAEIKEAMDSGAFQLILVNGAGPFGHMLVKNESPDEDVRESVRLQNERLITELRAAGINAVPVPPSESASFKDDRFDIGYLWDISELLLEENKVPSTYGDVLDNGKIISGDDLVVLIAEKWHADKIIVATDVDGVYAKDPKTSAGAKFLKELKLSGGENPEYALNRIDVTGGMQSKVEKLKDAVAAGIACRIINGTIAGNVKAALLGDDSFGTSIVS